MYGTQPLQSYGALPPTIPAGAQYVNAAPQYNFGGTQVIDSTPQFGYSSVDIPTIPMSSLTGLNAGTAQFGTLPQQFVQYDAQPQYEYVQAAAAVPQYQFTTAAPQYAPQQSQLVVYEEPASVQPVQAGALVPHSAKPMVNYLPTPNLPVEGGQLVPNFGAPGTPAPVLTDAQILARNQRSGLAEFERQRAMKKLMERGRVMDAFSNLQTIRNEEIVRTEQQRMARDQAAFQKQQGIDNKAAQKQYAKQQQEYAKQMKAYQAQMKKNGGMPPQ